MQNKIINMILGIFLLLSGFVYSQGGEYPKYYTDVDGKKYILFTIEQAKQIDKDYQILNILKNLNVVYDDSEKVNIQIINSLNEKVYQLEVKCKELSSINTDNENIIEELKKNIKDYELMNINNNKIIGEKDNQISIYKSSYRKQKFLKIVFIVTSGVLATALLVK